MRFIILIVGLFSSTALFGQTCYLLSETPSSWDESSEKLCIDRIFMLVNPDQEESPTNPRIEKTWIRLMAAKPLVQHVVASYILDVLPSEPGTTTFGVAIPSNSIFHNITVSFEDINEADDRNERGKVRIGSSLYYYRSLGTPE